LKRRNRDGSVLRPALAHPNAGHRWSAEDQEDLVRYWDVGVLVAAIAVALGRKR
jgi:hypothetical protein